MLIPVSLDYLINANLYMGFNSTFRHQSMLYYISNVKCNVDIINMALTLVNIKIFFTFLQKIYFNKGFVWLNLFLFDFSFKKFFRKHALYNLFRRLSSKFLKDSFKAFKKYNLFILYQKWDNGLVSNYKRLRKHWKRKPYFKLFKLKFPQTVMLLSKVSLNRFKVPSMHVVDTSTCINKSLYFINANQKSLKTMLFFVRLIVKKIIVYRRLRKLSFRKFVLNVI